MSDAAAPATAPAPAPAPAAASPAPAAPSPAPAAPAPAPAAPAPAPAPGPQDSLLPKPGEAPAAAPAPGASPAPAADPLAWLPEKYRVMNDKGELDLAASSKKLGEGYGNLAKKLGTGDAPPATAAEYVYTPPEQYKDVQLDESLSGPFRERAHAAGLTQQQFDFVMGEYFQLVPQVLDAAAKLSASEARAELSKVWKTPTELDAGVAQAARAIGAADASIRESLWAKFGRDPDFIRFAAGMGKEMAEDTSPNNAGGGTAEDVTALMSSPAYRDPKHADHAKVSEQVRQHFVKKFGNGATVQ